MSNLTLSTPTPDETPESLGLLPSRVDWQSVVSRNDDALTNDFIMRQEDDFLSDITALDDFDAIGSECTGGICGLSDSDLAFLDMDLGA